MSDITICKRCGQQAAYGCCSWRDSVTDLTDGETVLDKPQKPNTCDTAAIRARLAAATPDAPANWGDEDCHRCEKCQVHGCDACASCPSGCDALHTWYDVRRDFHAHAPADIAALLAEVERLRQDVLQEDLSALRAENARLRDEVARYEAASETPLGHMLTKVRTERDALKAQLLNLRDAVSAESTSVDESCRIARETRAQLARAVAALEGVARMSSTTKLRKVVTDALASIRTTEGG